MNISDDKNKAEYSFVPSGAERCGFTAFPRDHADAALAELAQNGMSALLSSAGMK